MRLSKQFRKVNSKKFEGVAEEYLNSQVGKARKSGKHARYFSALSGYGSLGDGTTTNSSTPVQVSGISSIVEVAAGFEHSLALKDDGTVWAWGRNYGGLLGDGIYTYRSTPVQVSGLSGVTDVAVGNEHSFAASTMPRDALLPINYLYCKLGQEVCAGTQRKDDKYGTRHRDTIRAGRGEDRIYANLGQDVAYGGDDNDYIEGSYGSDRLYGGSGRDTIYTSSYYGDGDNHYADCGPGRDKVYREKRDTIENCEMVQNIGGGGGGY